MKRSQDVVKKDLEYICANLQKEFDCLGGNRLLITGGAGFLGYYLIHAILHWNKLAVRNQRIQVTVFDNFIRGFPLWMKDAYEDLTVTKHDLNHPLPREMGEYQFIIHAASIASPMFYRKYPIETMDANVNGLRSLLEFCLKQQAKGLPVKGFLYYSTSEIYGDPTPDNIPTPETYRGNVSCTGPRACYDESKRYGETLCVNFARQYHILVKTARPFNNYGPGLKITDKRVIPDFARDIFAGRDIVMHSDGSPTRTFCYVADAIIGYFKVLVNGTAGEAYNIGVESPEVAMRELARKLAEIAKEHFGYEGKVIRDVSKDADYLVDNPNRRCPIISKARRELGYNPSIPLEEGLLRSMIWYNENREAEEG